MEIPPQDLALSFVGTATYRIVVEGFLDPSYSDRVAGMKITVTKRGDLKPITTLFGSVSDQAELSGVGDRNLLLHTIERTTHAESESPMRTAV